MKYKNLVVLLCIIIAVVSCKEMPEKSNSSSEVSIIDKTYKASGSDKIGNSIISFKFRDKTYKAERNKGSFRLNREFSDSIGFIMDEYTNNGLVRYINDVESVIPDSMAIRYQESVNSVHYFSVLPYGLKDPAVNIEEKGEILMNGKTYNKLRVTFDEEGGGVDYEDEFYYWINSETNLVEYLAYKFNVDGGGMRFREAYNERIIDGIRFVDYKNYKPKDNNVPLDELDREFEKGQLQLLSVIELENIKVQLN